MLPVGSIAPDFSSFDHNGNPMSLKDFLGNKIVLWFYPKADTPGCTMEGQGFKQEFDKFQGKDMVILGVSLDTIDENRAFATKFDFPYPLLCDTSREIANAYEAVSGPEDKYAARITYVIGEDGTILEAINDVNTKSHASDICSRH